MTLTVSDNGIGIKAEKINGDNSLGILSMRERATFMEGELLIEGVPGQGTTVRVIVPAETWL